MCGDGDGQGGLHGLAEGIKFKVIVRGYWREVRIIIYVGIL